MSATIFDRMLFCLYGKDGQLINLVMCYVDNFFGIHREDHDPIELFGKFRWGERSYFVENESKNLQGERAHLCQKLPRQICPQNHHAEIPRHS